MFDTSIATHTAELYAALSDLHKVLAKMLKNPHHYTSWKLFI